MPVRYSIHPEFGAVFVRCSDPVDLEHLLAYAASLEGDAGLRPGLHELVDMRGVTRFRVDVRALAGVVDDDRQRAPGLGIARTAFVADDPLVLAKLEVYKDLARELPQEIALFNSLGSAMAWSGLPRFAAQSFAGTGQQV